VIKLTDIRRYAIDRRVELTVIDSISGHRCLINVRGQAVIPEKDRPLRIEEIIDGADSFELSLAGKIQALTRDEIDAVIADHFRSRGFSAASKEED
jgi:hypothetical protein